jgi:hypothetical protein
MTKITLVENWREFRHWLSVQLTVLVAVAQFGYEYSDALKGFVPESVFHHLTIVSLALILIGRIIKQRGS